MGPAAGRVGEGQDPEQVLGARRDHVVAAAARASARSRLELAAGPRLGEPVVVAAARRLARPRSCCCGRPQPECGSRGRAGACRVPAGGSCSHARCRRRGRARTCDRRYGPHLASRGRRRRAARAAPPPRASTTAATIRSALISRLPAADGSRETRRPELVAGEEQRGATIGEDRDPASSSGSAPGEIVACDRPSRWEAGRRRSRHRRSGRRTPRRPAPR